MKDDTGQMLAAQLDRLLGALLDPNRPEASPALESAFADLGLDLALVPEGQGGAGLGWRDLGPVFLTLGYHAAPGGLGERLIANALAARLGPVPDPAPALGFGALTVRDGRVSGSLTVPLSAGDRPVLAEGDGHLVLLPARAGTSRPLHGVAREPGEALVFSGAQPLAILPLDGPGPEALLAVLRAAQIAGALSRILGMTIEHGNTRQQFGRPIGKFQAVQHLVAELAAEAGAARAGVEFALGALDRGADWRAPAIAKIRASRAVGRAASVAHEVHGAIGITEEHALHHLTRRLWQWRDEAGSEHEWSERLGNAVLVRGGAQVWADIVALGGG